MLCRVAAVKSLPALIYSAACVLLLVLSDHGIYSENSEIIIRLDSFSKQFEIFWYFRLISVLRWRSGTVVRASAFGPRGPWFDSRPVHISLWP